MYNNDGYYVARVPDIPNANFKGCLENVTYDTVSPNYPMRDTLFGPSSLKQLYKKNEIGVTSEGNRVYKGNYIPQYMQVPLNTLYVDRRIKTPTGDLLLDETFRRYGGRANFFIPGEPEPLADQVFPFHQYSPKEIREIDQTIEYPALQNWTYYNTKRTGQFNR